MATLLSRIFAVGAIAFAAAGFCTSAVAAPEKQTKAKPAAKAKAKKPSKAAAATAAAAAVAAPAYGAEVIDEPDITDTIVTEYSCELGNKLTIYQNEGEDGHIALRWKKRVHRLSRVGTTTGAQRFENPHWGLIWIGIPAKGILLDSKLNRQLANECKNAEQAAPVVATAPAPMNG